ncbi:MAG: hypothetical protein R3B49_08970 [Phycisphaerales bacterium]
MCDRAYIIDSGRVLAEGTPRELINDDLVKRVYLGSLFRGDEFDTPNDPGSGGSPSDTDPGPRAKPRVRLPTPSPVGDPPARRRAAP